MLFDVENAMTHIANIDPTKTHRTQLAGSNLNAQGISSTRRTMAQVGGEKSDAFRFATLILRFASRSLTRLGVGRGTHLGQRPCAASNRPDTRTLSHQIKILPQSQLAFKGPSTHIPRLASASIGER
jgi:hypothetical protein